MTDARRYRLDDLRRFASALAVGAGVAPARASALAAHLLWFDAIGAPSFGIETLPTWLGQIDEHRIDPKAEGKVVSETLGTAVFDGQGGLPPLILARAGELATEKAREAGTGLVRVTNIGPAGPAAGIAADMAAGPLAAFLLGPGSSWSIALPSDEGLPAVYDSWLAAEGAPAPSESFLFWTSALLPENDWLVAAIGIKAIEPLPSFLERVGAVSRSLGEGAGRLSPIAWEARRRDAREHGVTILAPAWKLLMERAERLDSDRSLPAVTASPTTGAPQQEP